MDSPQPTREEFDELKAEFAALREDVTAIAGALNALVVVYTVHRLPPRSGQAPADSESPD